MDSLSPTSAASSSFADVADALALEWEVKNTFVHVRPVDDEAMTFSELSKLSRSDTLCNYRHLREERRAARAANGAGDQAPKTKRRKKKIRRTDSTDERAELNTMTSNDSLVNGPTPRGHRDFLRLDAWISGFACGILFMVFVFGVLWFVGAVSINAWPHEKRMAEALITSPARAVDSATPKGKLDGCDAAHNSNISVMANAFDAVLVRDSEGDSVANEVVSAAATVQSHSMENDKQEDTQRFGQRSCFAIFSVWLILVVVCGCLQAASMK